ncbi:MAG: response regulator [Chloroflexi bacterium]|nr:response regulator [Chloroflexota bacterium]
MALWMRIGAAGYRATSLPEVSAIWPRKFCIVDDDLDTLKLVGLILQRQGYEIVAANSGSQGLAKAAAEHPNLILLDVMMPDMEGYEVARRLRADADLSRTPIIMFTVKTMVDDKVAGFEAGVDDYMTKPHTPRRARVAGEGTVGARERRAKSHALHRLASGARQTDCHARRQRRTRRHHPGPQHCGGHGPNRQRCHPLRTAPRSRLAGPAARIQRQQSAGQLAWPPCRRNQFAPHRGPIGFARLRRPPVAGLVRASRNDDGGSRRAGRTMG